MIQNEVFEYIYEDYIDNAKSQLRNANIVTNKMDETIYVLCGSIFVTLKLKICARLLSCELNKFIEVFMPGLGVAIEVATYELQISKVFRQ